MICIIVPFFTFGSDEVFILFFKIMRTSFSVTDVKWFGTSKETNRALFNKHFLPRHFIHINFGKIFLVHNTYVLKQLVMQSNWQPYHTASTVNCHSCDWLNLGAIYKIRLVNKETEPLRFISSFPTITLELISLWIVVTDRHFLVPQVFFTCPVPVRLINQKSSGDYATWYPAHDRKTGRDRKV